MEKDDRIISRFDAELGAVHIVVAEDEVQGRSYQGYTLVAALYTDEPIQTMETESSPVTDPGYSTPNRRSEITRTVSHLARRVRFLMRLDATSALAIKQAELDEAVAAKYQAEKKRDAAVDHGSEIGKEKEKLARERDTLSANYRSAAHNYDEQRDLNRKLEADIAKVRKAVGELRMKEILGT